MFKKMVVLATTLLMFSVPLFADDPPPEPENLYLGSIYDGGENIWLTNMWDKRTIHSSYPAGGKIGSPGGWFISLSGPLSSSMGKVSRVEFIGIKRTIVINQPYPYHWLGSDETGFNIWLGNITEADDSFLVRCYDQNNQLMNFWENGVDLMTTAYGPIEPKIDLPAVPFVTIKKMRVRKKDLMVKVIVPTDPAGRDIHLRLRIYDGQDTNRMIKEIRYFPGTDFQVDEKAKLSVPSEYAGSRARFEYRASNYPEYPMARTVVWLTLPAE